MRILYLNTYYDEDIPNADALLHRYWTMTEWCGAVKRAGDDSVTVLQRFSADALIELNGVEYRFVHDSLASRPRWGLRLIHCLDAASTIAPDVVHLNGVPGPVSALRAILPHSSAMLWQHHGGPNPPRILRPLYRHALSRMDGVLFTSEEQGEEWHVQRILPSRVNVHALPECSVRVEPVPSTDARRALSITGSPLILWVGSLSRRKDPLTVLRGFARIRRSMPGASLFMIYGEKTLEAEVRAAIGTLELQEAVRLVGEVPNSDMALWHSAADLFLLGSHREGSGFALLEAMACGAWPVVTTIPAFRALTRDGSIGTLWNAGDAEDCTRALLEAAKTRVPRPLVRAFFAEHLSFDILGKRALDVYCAALRKRRNGGPA